DRGDDLRDRWPARRGRGRPLQPHVRRCQRDDGLPARDRGLHGRGPRRDRQHPRRRDRRPDPRDRRIGRSVHAPGGCPRALALRAERRGHVLDPRARAHLPARGDPRRRGGREGVSRRVFVRAAAQAGAIAGIVIVYFALVGMIEKFDALAIFGRVTLTWLLIVGPPALAVYLSLRPKVLAGETVEPDRGTVAVSAMVGGVATMVPVAALIGMVDWIGVDTVRGVFRSVSPGLTSILAFHMGTWAGTSMLFALVVGSALVGAAFDLVPPWWRRPIANGLSAVVLMGLLQRIVPTALDQIGLRRDWLYSRVTLGLTDVGAAITLLVTAGATLALRGRRVGDLLRPAPGPTDGQHPLEGRLGRRRTIAVIAWLAIAALLVALPYLVGPIVSRILGTVGIFLLLGLGLNIVVGYAGLLDLGYVAFFSVGAYLTAVLTGGQRVPFIGLRPPVFGAHLSFYAAIPIVVIVSAMIGLMIGAPVLRLRGDYLAIVTLGFGEIARVVFGSTWARSPFGGS